MFIRATLFRNSALGEPPARGKGSIPTFFKYSLADSSLLSA